MAIVVTALLCACGGGGNGNTLPPTATPTPATSQIAGSITVGTTPQATTISGTGQIASTAIALPATTGASGAIGLTFSLTPPTGLSAVQSSFRRPANIGGSLNPIAYITFTPAATVAFAATPGFTYSLASGVTVPAGMNAYVALYNPQQAALGWQAFLGPGTIGGQTIAFAQVSESVTFQAGVTYVFALFTTAQLLGGASPSPSPVVSASPSPATSPSPAATPTTFAGGASLVANFTANLPAAGRSAVFTFTSGATALSNVIPIPAGCGSPPPCSVTVSAPIGSNQGLLALVYGSSNGSGTPLAAGTGTASIIANQSTTYNFALNGIMASYTVSLTPPTVTVGQTTSIKITENAFDAAGEPLAPGFVNLQLAAPVFTLSVTDPTGLSLYSNYSGVGSGPLSYTAQTPNYPPASASPQFAAASSFQLGYATVNYNWTQGAATCYVNEYATDATTPGRSYAVPCNSNPLVTVQPHFDPSGTLWGVNALGIGANGSSAGTLAFTGQLLSYDVNGNAYVSDAQSNAVDVYSSSSQLLRQILTTAAPSTAVADPSGNVFIGLASGGVSEYAPGGASGTVTPIATNTSLSGPSTATDPSGNFYASWNGGIGMWPAGTLASAPHVTITSPLSNNGITFTCCNGGAAVDHNGNVYGAQQAHEPDIGPPGAIFYAPAGSTTLAQLLSGCFESQLGNYCQTLVATPLK